MHFTGQDSTSSSTLSGTIVFGIDFRANLKHHCSEEVSCETLSVMHVAQLLLSLCSPDAELIIATSNGSSERCDLGHLKLNFEFSSSTHVTVKFKVPRICLKYNFECVHFFRRHLYFFHWLCFWYDPRNKETFFSSRSLIDFVASNNLFTVRMVLNFYVLDEFRDSEF
jgi:hypothetical protein